MKKKTRKKQKSMLLSPSSVTSQVALMGSILCLNGPLKYAHAFKICPFMLLDFINFLRPTMNIYVEKFYFKKNI